MTNDLKILITGSLQSDKSKIEINKKIKELESQLDKIKLTIRIDEKVSKTLSDFSKAMENHKKIAQDLNKVIKEEKTVTKEADGTIKEKIRQHLKSGEVIEKEIEKINKKTKAMKQEEDEIGKLISQYDRLGQKQKEITRQNAKGDVTNGSLKYRDNFTDTTYKTNKNGEVTSTTTVQNLDQQRKAIEQLRTKLNELRQTGELSEKTLSRLGNSINSAQTVAEIDKIRNRLNVLDDATQTRQKNRALEEQIKLYQRQAQIQVNTLRNNPNKIIGNTQNSQLDNYLNQVNNLRVNPQLQSQLRNLNLDFREISGSIQTAGRNTMTWGQALSTAMQKFPIWMVASTAFFQSFNFFREGIIYVNELNKSLTEIAIVTGKSQAEVAKLGEEYQKLAHSMGVLTTDIATATKEFYRQGLSQEEVMNRTAIATQYAKISALDFKTSAQVLTATVNSMGVDITRAADVFSYLGDATATGADEVGQAFQRVGGSAGAINLEFEKVASWIAVLSSRTREGAGTIGNSIKSIIARVQNLKETGFDSEDGTTINQVAKALNAVGIALVDNDGEFRNFGTVMDELGAKWETLDNRSKAYISTTVAGTYQQSKFLNLMEGYKDTIPLYEKALESAGTTQEKFNQYQLGTEATLNRLKSTWQGVWQSSFDSEAIRNVIGALDLMAKGFKATIDTIGFLPTLLGLTTTAFLAFNTATRTAIMSTGALSVSLARTGDSMRIATGASRAYQIALYNTTLAARSTGAAVTFLGTALKSAFTFISRVALPIAGIMLIGTAIGKVSEEISEYNQKQEKIKKENENIRKSYVAHSDEVNKLLKNYISLNEQVEKGQISKSNEDYISTANRLNEIFPVLTSHVDQQGNAHLRNVEQMKKEVEYAEQLKDNYALLQATTFEDSLDDQQKKFDDLLNKAIQTENKLKGNIAGSDATAYTNSVKTEEERLLLQRELIQNEREMQLMLYSSKDYIKDKSSAFLELSGATQNLSDDNQKTIDSFIQEKIALADVTKEGFDFQKFLKDLVNDSTDLGEKLASVPESLKGMFDEDSVNNLSKNQIAVLSSIKSSVEDGYTTWDSYRVVLSKAGFTAEEVNQIIGRLNGSIDDQSKSTQVAAMSAEDLAKRLSDVKGNFTSITEIIMELAKAGQSNEAVITAQTDAYSALADEISPLNSLLETMAEGKAISAAEAMELISKEEELANAISIENGVVKVNEEAVKNLRDAKVSAYQDMLNATKLEVIESTKALATKLKNYGIEIKAIQSVADAKAALAQANATFDSQLQGATSIGQAMEIERRKKESIGSIQGIADALNSLESLSGLASTGLTQVGTSYEKLSSSSDKSTKATKDSIYVTDAFKQAMELLNLELEKLHKIQNDYPKTSKQYQDSIRKEIKLLDQKKKLTSDQIKLLSTQISKGNIAQTGMVKVSSTSASSSTYASGGDNASQIWNFFRSKGFSDSIVAGIMGNLKLESGLNPNAVNRSSGASGIAQWLGGRKTGLQNYAKSMGTSWNNLQTQLEYLWKELNGSEKRTLNYLNSNQNASASTIAYEFDRLFERSEGTHRPQRAKYANDFLNQYAGGKASGGSAVVYSDTVSENAQNIDEAKSQVLQLQQDILNVQQQISELNMMLINSVTAEQDRKINSYRDDMAALDFLQSRNDELSESWRNLEKERARQLEKQREYQEQSIKYLNEQYRVNTALTSAQRSQLAEEVADRTVELTNLQQAINDSYKAIRESQVNANIESINKLYDSEIEKIQEKLKLLDEVEKAEDRIKTLKEKQDEIDKARSDTRFEYINENGEIELTYDKGLVADLEKQLDELKDDYAKEDERASLEKQIADMETKRESSIESMNKMLEDYAYKAYSNTEQLQNIMKQFVADLSTMYQSAITLPQPTDGGIVGSVKSSSKLTNLVNTLFMKPNEELVKALKDEGVISQRNIPNFFSDMQSKINGILGNRSNVQQTVQNYNLSNFTVVADNPTDFLVGLETLIRSE